MSHTRPQLRLLRLRLCHLLSVLLWLAASNASFDTNLNYKSPSVRHPSLGVHPSRLLFRRESDGTSDKSKFIKPDHLDFTHGVASGDPMEDSVILWTRISPTADNEDAEIVPSGLRLSEDGDGAGAGGIVACVNYRVSEDERLRKHVSVGRAYTNADTDWTVKVRFEHASLRSPYTAGFHLEGKG